MASLLEKVGILISANLHWMVNQALEANSLAVVDEYIRRVEDNLEALEDAAATVGGESKTLRRKQREFEAKAEELDRNIDLFLSEGNDSLAMAAQSRYNTMKDLANTYREQADAQEELVRLFRTSGIDSIQLHTDKPYITALEQFFEMRLKRRHLAA
jgi:phage shock protein A